MLPKDLKAPAIMTFLQVSLFIMSMSCFLKSLSPILYLFVIFLASLMAFFALGSRTPTRPIMPAAIPNTPIKPYALLQPADFINMILKLDSAIPRKFPVDKMAFAVPLLSGGK